MNGTMKDKMRHLWNEM